jgi:hypothetical protein
LYRLLLKKVLRAGASRQLGGLPCYAATAPAGARNPGLVNVRLPDGSLVQGEPADGQGPAPAAVSGGITFDGRRRRRWYSRVPRWVRWSAGTAIVILFFRRAVTWAVITGASGALHLTGVNPHLPHVTFGWPWSPLTAPAASSDVLVGPLVLAKIEGIDALALGSTTFDFLFTHKVSHSMGFLPCWYSATFYAVGKASATVDLNPGPAWWNPATGHYVLTVLSKPAGGMPGRVSVTMTLPVPQLPQTVHDVYVDNTLSRQVSADHSWTYPRAGLRRRHQPAVHPAGPVRPGAAGGVHPGHHRQERQPAADRSRREASRHDHRRQLHHPSARRARLQGGQLHAPLGSAGE